MEASPEQLAAATRQAIAGATDFDERDVNYNFDYDGAADEEVKRNLGRLIGLGELRLAMDLLLELMKEGSYQVEASDEGLMTDDIADGPRVVIKALEECDLPPEQILAWCERMIKNDHVGRPHRAGQGIGRHSGLSFA